MTTALLDTSVQIDRCKMGSRLRSLDDLIGQFDMSMTTSISLLEFKATIIRECIIIHNQLRLKGHFTEARDALLEKQYRQTSLRAHIFKNLLNVHGSSFSITPDEDAQLAERARLLLEVHIRQLYRFRENSTDAVLFDRVDCTRAQEEPEKKTVSLANIMHELRFRVGHMDL